MSTGIEWTDETAVVDRGGRRVRYYKRADASRPGQQERRRQRALGLAWCRGCQDWLPLPDVDRRGACRRCINAEYRAQYAASPEAIRQRVHARKRSLDPIPGWWAAEHRDVFGGLCAYGCGREAAGWDHIWPVNRGGRSVPGNLVPACGSCNSSKSDNAPGAWVELGVASFPHQWADVIALAIEHGTDEWLQTMLDGRTWDQYPAVAS